MKHLLTINDFLDFKSNRTANNTLMLIILIVYRYICALMRSAVIYRLIIVLISVSLAATGCGEFKRVQRSDDWRVKYEAAIKYYEDRDYFRSNVLFEDIIPLIKGLEEGELAQFYNAYTYYYQRQYLLSSHYFKTFATVYSRSEHAEEASFMSAYSLYQQSPEYNLDQSSTINAIDELQRFINRNPASEYTPQATELIDNLQYKKAKKQFEIAKQYLKVRKYLAAAESFETFAEDFPDSEFVEEALFLMVKTQYLYANNSIVSKQVERYQETITLYQNFIDSYPSTSFSKQAENIFSDSVEKIRKIKENQS